MTESFDESIIEGNIESESETPSRNCLSCLLKCVVSYAVISAVIAGVTGVVAKDWQAFFGVFLVMLMPPSFLVMAIGVLTVLDEYKRSSAMSSYRHKLKKRGPISDEEFAAEFKDYVFIDAREVRAWAAGFLQMDRQYIRPEDQFATGISADIARIWAVHFVSQITDLRDPDGERLARRIPVEASLGTQIRWLENQLRLLSNAPELSRDKLLFDADAEKMIDDLQDDRERFVESQRQKFLPQDPLGRFTVGLLGVFFLIPSAIALPMVFFPNPRPAINLQQWLMAGVLRSFIVSLFAVSILSIVWACFRPQFLAKQIEQTSIGLFILVLVALAAIFLM